MKNTFRTLAIASLLYLPACAGDKPTEGIFVCPEGKVCDEQPGGIVEDVATALAAPSWVDLLGFDESNYSENECRSMGAIAVWGMEQKARGASLLDSLDALTKHNIALRAKGEAPLFEPIIYALILKGAHSMPYQVDTWNPGANAGAAQYRQQVEFNCLSGKYPK